MCTRILTSAAKTEDLPTTQKSLEKTQAVSEPFLSVHWAVTQVCVGLHEMSNSSQVPDAMIRTAWRVPGCTSAVQYRCKRRGLCAGSGFTLAYYKQMLLTT